MDRLTPGFGDLHSQGIGKAALDPRAAWRQGLEDTMRPLRGEGPEGSTSFSSSSLSMLRHFWLRVEVMSTDRLDRDFGRRKES